MSVTTRRGRGTRVLLSLVVALAALGSSAADATMPPRASSAFASLGEYRLLGRSIAFPTLASRDGAGAVAVDDPGVAALFDAARATVRTTADGVTVTTADGQALHFSVGSDVYVANGEAHAAAFAPFRAAGSIVVPFDALLAELGFGPARDGDTVVLVPQLETIMLAAMGDATYVALHAAVPLRARVVSSASGRAVVSLADTGAPRVSDDPDVAVGVAGTAADPATTVTVAVPPGSAISVVPGGDPDTIVVVAIAPQDRDSGRGTTSIVPAAGPERERLIVLDPGHGGSDPGAIHGGLVEKDVALEMARRLRPLLVARGWDVRLTRETDRDVTHPNPPARDELQARDDVADRLGAALFVSLHGNAFRLSSANGTTTYWYTPRSQAFADAVHARLAAMLPTADDGVRHENYYVIRHAAMPAILIEAAFLSNPDDARDLASPEFLQRFAIAVADGIDDYARDANESDR